MSCLLGEMNEFFIFLVGTPPVETFHGLTEIQWSWYSSVVATIGALATITSVIVTWKTWKEMLRQREEEIKINKLKLRVKIFENFDPENNETIKYFNKIIAEEEKSIDKIINLMLFFYKSEKIEEIYKSIYDSYYRKISAISYEINKEIFLCNWSLLFIDFYNSFEIIENEGKLFDEIFYSKEFENFYSISERMRRNKNVKFFERMIEYSSTELHQKIIKKYIE